MKSHLVGETLGQYQILEELGRGGMAVVYKAYHPALARYVAIKVLPRELTFDREFVERFTREARAAAHLNHPHIVTIHDVGQAEGVHFMVMEFVDGLSLTDLLRRQGPLPPERVRPIISQVASALDYAHHQGFVHRDIKPGNILLGAGGAAKLTDFGIVKAAEGTRLTQTGTLLGTPEYMSPEQARGSGIGHATDIYSLGVVAYEMLSGRVPFSGGTMAVLHAHAYDPPDLSVLSPPVQSVIGRALAKDPRRRYGSAGAFAHALEPALAGMPVGAAEPPRQARHRPSQGRRSSAPGWVWALGAAAAVLALGVVVAVATGDHTAQTPPRTPMQSPTALPTYTLDRRQSSPTPPDTASPAPTEETASPTPFSTPTRDVTLHWSDIGRSAQGRELSMAVIGEPARCAVVVAGCIQGDQETTRELVRSLIDYLERHPEQVLEDVAFYMLPSLNPDGYAADSRFNANGVDLNRNWDTADWRSKAAVPGYPQGKPGAGGSRPFSESETAAAADFISGLRRQGRKALVIILHSSVRRSTGEVYPGGDNSLEMAYRYASATGYDVEDQWKEYTTSGEMVTWCAEQGIPSIDVVIPASQHPSSRVPGTNSTLQDLTADTLFSLAQSLEQ